MLGVGVWTLGELRVFDRQANDRAQPSPVCERLLAVVQQADNDVPAIRGRELHLESTVASAGLPTRGHRQQIDLHPSELGQRTLFPAGGAEITDGRRACRAIDLDARSETSTTSQDEKRGGHDDEQERADEHFGQGRTSVTRSASPPASQPRYRPISRKVPKSVMVMLPPA
jgi:hypothetical protein